MNLFEAEFLRGKSQPITHEMVEQAYRKVESNGGAASVDGKDMSFMESQYFPGKVVCQECEEGKPLKQCCIKDEGRPLEVDIQV